VGKAISEAAAVFMNGSGQLFRRHEGGPILSARECSWPVNSVFNAGATLLDEETLLMLRVEDRCGHSHFTIARSPDGIGDWRVDAKPVFSPDTAHPEETWGVEDPRLTRIEDAGVWVMAYTAYSDQGALVSLATTTDFTTVHRLGPALAPDNKDAALFPVRFGGRYAMLHRPVPAMPGHAANIWIAFSPDMLHWGGHRQIMAARGPGWWDGAKIGIGPPPMATSEGWLLLYHGVRRIAGQDIYRLGLALLDLEDPTRVIRRGREWVFGPQTAYERSGDVNNVVFPCGWTCINDEIRLYYGAADTTLALATVSLTEVLDWLKHEK